MILSNIRKAKKPIDPGHQQIDKGRKNCFLPIIAEYGETRSFRSIIPISALTGDGVENLLRELKSMLREGPAFFPDDVQTDQSESFLVSETIREKIFLHTPAGTALLQRCDGRSFEELPERDLVSISAKIT